MPLDLLFLITVAGLIYGLPAFIAFFRQHPNRWLILVICIAFGATVFGWLIALVWALSAFHRSPTGNHGGESGLNLFVNDVQTVRVEPDRREADGDTPSDNPKAGSGDTPQRPPAPDPIEQLAKLKTLFEQGVLGQEEYEALRRQIIEGLDAQSKKPTKTDLCSLR